MPIFISVCNFERFLFHIIFFIANNLVEVYINAHGTASTRCPSSTCQHQSSKENGSTWHQLRATTPTAIPQSNGHSHHLNNHHLQESSHGATTSTIIGGSAKTQSPGLRRYSVITFFCIGTKIRFRNTRIKLFHFLYS